MARKNRNVRARNVSRAAQRVTQVRRSSNKRRYDEQAESQRCPARVADHARSPQEHEA